MRNRLFQPTFVFDLDNTLVETDRANNLSYKDAITSVLGRDFNWDFKKRFTRNQLYLCFPNLLPQQYEKVVKTKNDRFNAYMSETKSNNNLFRVLSMLHRYGCCTILLTNCHRRRALAICNYYGISSLFTEKYFAEDKDGNKYEVLTRKGYNLRNIVLFENEAEEAYEAMKHGILQKNIISVKF